MRLILPGFALLLVAGCGSAEIPPIEIGGGGARLMNGRARDAVDAYQMAYAQLSPQHHRVRASLEPRGQNLHGAKVGVEAIIYYLETMKSVVTPAWQGRFEPYLAKYREWVQDISRNTWGGSFLQDFERTGQEVRSRFRPDLVEFADPAAAAPEAKPPSPPAVPPETPPPPKAPAEQPVNRPPQKPEAGPPAPGLSAGLLFRAWDGAHNDLIAAYKQKKDVRSRYEMVQEALGHLKRQLPADRAGRLQIYIDYYAALHDRTKGFTLLPEKTTEQDVVDELNVAARVIRNEFNPDK